MSTPLYTLIPLPKTTVVTDALRAVFDPSEEERVRRYLAQEAGDPDHLDGHRHTEPVPISVFTGSNI